MAYNLFAQQKLTKPVPASDPSRTVEENLSGQDSPTGQNVATAYTTPTAKLQTQPVVQPVQHPQAVTQQPKTIASTEDLAAALGYTSPEQEEKMRKASLMNRRILAVGDALRHIGNIANTINYAPAQKFNSPVQEEELRYQRGKLLRDKANTTYIKYQQAKEAQDRAAKQWEQQFNLNIANAASQDAYRREQARIAAERAANDKENKDKMYELGKGRLDETIRANKARQESADRHQRVIESQGWSRINETKRHNSVVERRGSGKNSTTTVHSRRGYLTKDGISEQDMKRVYDNLYEWGKNKGYIKNNSKLPEAYAALEEQKMSDVRKREAVDKLIMEHDDAAVLLHSKYGFDWHEQKPNDKALGIGIGSENGKGKSLGLGL